MMDLPEHSSLTRKKDNLWIYSRSNENFYKNAAQSDQTTFLMGGFPSLFFYTQEVSNLEFKVHSKEIPQAKRAVPQTPQFTTDLSPPHELLTLMEVLNELGFLQERRHVPHVKPIIKTQSYFSIVFLSLQGIFNAEID